MNQIHFIRKGKIEIVEGCGEHIFSRQTHESYIFGTILSGKTKVRIGKETAEMREGQCYVLPSGMPLEARPKGEAAYLCICLKGDLAKRFQKCRPSSCFAVKRNEAFLSYIEQFKKEQIQEKALADDLALLFSLNRETEKELSGTVLCMTRYISAHADDKFSLEKLAEKAGFSKYYFIRKFKKLMNVTPKQYHQQCRVRKIKEKLEWGNQSELSYDMQFSSQSHMGSIFMKYMGISPGQYAAEINTLALERERGQ